MGARRKWVVVAVLAVLAAAAASRSVLADTAPVAAGAGPGCGATVAVAHHPDGAVLDPRPAGAPVLCTAYTGFPGGESRIEVSNDGAVLFSPAPYERGVLSLGYGPDD